MKRIHIQEFTPPKHTVVMDTDKMYCVPLGNETVNYFSSKRHCEAFLAQTNNFLNDCLYSLNKYYGNVFTEYRRIWAFTDKYERSALEIDSLLSAVDRQLNMACKQTVYSSNHRPFACLFCAIADLKKCCEIINTIYKKRKYYNEIRDLRLLSKQIDTVHVDLNEYGNQDTKPTFIVID